MVVRRPLVTVTVALVLGLLAAPVAADYKPEFKTSIVVSEQTPWGQAANRFATAVRYRTQGRINIKNYFDGQLFADKQTAEFPLLQQGVADFALGSTINWSAQVKELNLFALPFMFPSYQALDAVQASEPGRRLFKLIEQKGVVPIAWGENGFRELTNSKRPVRRPEDLQGLKVRVVGIPIFVETFRALGANPVTMNLGEMLAALQQGTIDGQENPIALIVPYRFWSGTRRRHDRPRHPAEDLRNGGGPSLAGRCQGVPRQDPPCLHEMGRGDRCRPGSQRGNYCGEREVAAADRRSSMPSGSHLPPAGCNGPTVVPSRKLRPHRAP